MCPCRPSKRRKTTRKGARHLFRRNGAWHLFRGDGRETGCAAGGERDVTRRCTPVEERAFLRSVLYAAVFDYPLTVEQLHEAFIDVRATCQDIVRWYGESYALQQAIEFSDGYFFPRGRRDLLAIRHAREVISRSVLKELRQPLALVLRMPF